MLSSSLNFARYFFAARHPGLRYQVGRHHRLICQALDRVLAGHCRRLIINIAPRYGKTLLAVHSFISMGLAVNPRAKFIHLSYSDTLAQDNSVAIKDIITDEAFTRLFPARVKQGSDTKSRWSTVQGGGVYAISTLGQVTGFGAGLVRHKGDPYEFGGAIVIDDPIKPEDALSDLARERVNRRFETTIRNRVNDRQTPIVIIMQRLHEHDLCGYLTGLEPDSWEVLSLPCIEQSPDGTEMPLWPFKHTLSELYSIRQTSAFVFDTQYMQNPKPLEGLMYSGFRTYDTLPVGHLKRCSYTDTADTGADYTCSVCYCRSQDGDLYVTDVLYTQRPMEYTEPETARMLMRNDTEVADVESNNGGRGFARNVEAIVRKQGNYWMQFSTFTQRANKQSRIFSHSAEVQNTVYFPSDWQVRWPAFYNAMTGYRQEGGNAHDDAPDAVTGMVERSHKGGEVDIRRLAMALNR